MIPVDEATARELGQRRERLLLRWLWTVIVGGVVLLGTVVLLGAYFVGIEAVTAVQAALSPYLHVARTAVEIGAIGCWPYLMLRLGAWLYWGPVFTEAMVRWRWRAALWIALIELVIVYEMPFVFLQRMAGGGQ